MSTAIAARMTGADLMKLRKKRTTVIWSAVLALAPLLIFFIVRAAQHSSNPTEFAPAGGIHGFTDGMRLLAAVFAPLMAILVGAEAGAGDAASGVFRDLVVTGRSRIALFSSRVPAAVALTWAIATVGYLLLLIGTLAFASGASTPSGSQFLDGYGFTLLSTGVVCGLAVGFGSLTTSRPATLVVLIGWDLIASPILASIKSLGSVRKLLFSQAVVHFSPVNFGEGPRGMEVTMSAATAILVLAVWLVLFIGLGAWRTRTMDA